MTGNIGLRSVLATTVLCIVLATPSGAQESEPSTAYNGAVGLGAALCTLVYSPLKVAYAATGFVVTSLVFIWTFGDTNAAGPVWRTTVGGDYVVAPAVLEGRRSLRFRGDG